MLYFRPRASIVPDWVVNPRDAYCYSLYLQYWLPRDFQTSIQLVIQTQCFHWFQLPVSCCWGQCGNTSERMVQSACRLQRPSRSLHVLFNCIANHSHWRIYTLPNKNPPKQAIHVARTDHSVIFVLLSNWVGFIDNNGSSSCGCGSCVERGKEEDNVVLRNVLLFVDPFIFQAMQWVYIKGESKKERKKHKFADKNNQMSSYILFKQSIKRVTWTMWRGV